MASLVHITKDSPLYRPDLVNSAWTKVKRIIAVDERSFYREKRRFLGIPIKGWDTEAIERWADTPYTTVWMMEVFRTEYGIELTSEGQALRELFRLFKGEGDLLLSSYLASILKNIVEGRHD